MVEMHRPGGALAVRRLPIYFLVDASGSMAAQGKMQALNNAVRESLPQMRRVAAENPNAEVVAGVVHFSDGARWAGDRAVPLAEFEWPEAEPGGGTDLGAALKLVAEALHPIDVHDRALPPVLVLLTDGYATDDVESGLAALMAEPWGAKAVRTAIAIGRDADADVLQRFIADPTIPPLTARNAEDLVKYVRWASTSVVRMASAPSVRRDAGIDLQVLDITTESTW